MNTKPPRPKSSRTNLASCVVATVFLIFIAMVALIVFFTLFRPKSPEISVNTVMLPAFSASDNGSSLTFTFSQYNTVRNPNRAEFTHYDGTLELLHGGNQVGFVFIPAGTIDAGRTKYMSATFSIQSFPFAAAAAGEREGMSVDGGAIGGGAPPMRLEMESRMKMEGRVRVLAIFTHHVETTVDCRVEIDVSRGSVVGFRC